jgi:hypothetical protein
MAKAATAEQIEQLLRDYRNRGEMTRRGFCESRGMSLSMLDYYLRRYGTDTKAQSAKLVRVKVEAAEASGTFTVVLANGRRIESAWNFGDGELARLIRIVEAA